MILIADGGSTKVDWIALDENKNQLFKVRTAGLNPAVLSREVLQERIVNDFELVKQRSKVTNVFFYGAGCGSPESSIILEQILQTIFYNSNIVIEEDTTGAVYAVANEKPAIICVIGTGSNSCFFDGDKIVSNAPSLGYSVMDEASGNYFGKQLLKDYFYKKMPEGIRKQFSHEFNLTADFVRYNLYQLPNPNTYLAGFAKFMFDFKDNPYIHQLIYKGFTEFFVCRVLPYKQTKDTPIYFIGSIAYFFRDILNNVAQNYNIEITDFIQHPIHNLIEYHKKRLEISKLEVSN